MALPYTYCTRIGLGFLAEACGKRGPASNTATDARAIGDDVAEFSGGRPNRASLVFGRSMLRFNDCLFRLGDIGLVPCREQNQSAWQAEAPAPPWSAPLHVLASAAGGSKPSARRQAIRSFRLIGATAGIQATSRISRRLPSMSGIGE